MIIFGKIMCVGDKKLAFTLGKYISWIAVVQWLASGTPTRTIRVRFPSDWLWHHGNNRGRHSANHNLLPDMHLRVPVLCVKTCRDSRLV